MSGTLPMLVTFAVFMGLSVFRNSLSAGDAKVGLLLGAGLGTDVAYAMLIGFLVLWPFAVYVALQGAGEGRKTAIPLTPALALGAAVVVLAG